MAKKLDWLFDEVKCTSFAIFLIILIWVVYLIIHFNLFNNPNFQYYAFFFAQSKNYDEFLNKLSVISLGALGLIFIYLVKVIHRVIWHKDHMPQNLSAFKIEFNIGTAWKSGRWLLERLFYTLILIANLFIVAYLIVIFGVNYVGALWVGLTYYTTIKGALQLLGVKK